MKPSSLAMTIFFAAFAAASQGSPGSAPTPFGSWRSPITAQMLVQGAVGFGDMSIDGDTLYWVESRPEEAGRYVIVRRTPDGKIADVLPPPFSDRTTAHEYGGGALLAAEAVIYFSNYADQRIWRIKPCQPPQPLTALGPLRFADCVLDRARHRLIGICEDHSSSPSI
jgi:hypothetical protein